LPVRKLQSISKPDVDERRSGLVVQASARPGT
jgi:hypothetical protein